MLDIPSKGFAESVTVHNGDLAIHVDWVEASLLFAAESLSRSDIVDVLIENNIYHNQDFANEWVGNLFPEIDRRIAMLGKGGALRRDRNRIVRSMSWENYPAYAFCVALGILPLYGQLRGDGVGHDYSEQGRLFERLSEESLKAQNWDVCSVGWSKERAESLVEKIGHLASTVGENSVQGAAELWTEPHAKDCGLDLMAWYGFGDARTGRPICLVQCASGANWDQKLHTPNLQTWKKLIDFATEPRRGMTIPFALDDDTLRRRANTDLLMFILDRHRLLVPARYDQNAFPSVGLRDELVAWTRGRLDSLQTV
jgi:hypothetical protein